MCTGHSFPASMVSSGYLLDSYADATTSLTHTTPPFLSAATAALLLYDPKATMRHPTLLVAASHQRPPPFLSSYSAPFLQTKIIVVLATSLRTAINGKPPCHRVFNEPCPLPTMAAYHAHTHHVRQRPQPPSPPYTSAPTSCSRYGIECTQTRPCPRPPCPLAAADRISEGLCLAPTCLGRAHRSRQSNDVVPRELGGLRTGGDAIHPCRARNLRLYGARARLLGVTLTGPLRVRRQQRGTFPRRCLQAVVSAERCAIRASVSEAPANPGTGTRPPRNARQRARLGRPMLPPSPFDALLNAQRVFTAVGLRPPSPYPLHCAAISSGIGSHSTPPVHQRHHPYPSRPRQWAIRAPEDRRTRTPPC
ncbi:hypothetical protein B0H14DRAFT_1482511 [Mycena olivaceomarginata]|nr:hypothetical protein B0H14DRAFT_1482511 [Mycena olivaceomarginata]